MSETNRTPNFSVLAQKIKYDTARMAATEAQKFFRDCFQKGGWTDESFQKWQDKKSPFGGKKTLYREGNLMSSIRNTEESENRLVVGSNLKHAEIHNNGGTITVTKNMKLHFWKLYCEILGIPKKQKGKKTDWNDKRNLQLTAGGKEKKSAHNKKLNAKAEFCKRMALMKVGAKIKIPKRQFIGESKTLMNQFDTWLKNEIETRFNNGL